MPIVGKLAFFPWLTLPKPIRSGGFYFVPISTSDPRPVIGDEIADTAKQIFSRYVDIHGKPIETCTVALRPRHSRAWDIPERLWPRLFGASECLALIAMAEQRFLEQFTPHVNATVFRPIVQGIVPGQKSLSLFVKRRGKSLSVGGLKFGDVMFQKPLEALYTECPVPSQTFARALNTARTNNSDAWIAVRQSLPFFLLGHSEAIATPDETCVMMSALAFERLLSLPHNVRNNANNVSRAFASLWNGHGKIRVADARRVKADPHPTDGLEQRDWPLHRKWMKELYEARSEQAHGNKAPKRSSNWHPHQHVVLAAFIYPLTVKLRLAAEGRYQLTVREQGACDAIDKLLDSDWGNGWRRPPEWSSVLSMSEGSRELTDIIERAIAESKTSADNY